jgi:hypothetical protein
LSASEREENSGRQPQKRKYALGGRKKLRSVTTILEAHLEEMLGINENERHEFYAKMVSMPAVVAAGVTRDEILSWYKRARKKSRALASKASKAAGYILYSWGASSEAKCELIRLLFSVAGVQLTEDASEFPIIEGCDGSHLGVGFPYPAKCPPIVSGPDGYNCSQTPVILSSLGKRFGLYPDEADDAHCMALSNSVVEFVCEFERNVTKNEGVIDNSVSSWLDHFEHCLRVTADGAMSYFFSARLTYCDVVIFHAINLIERTCPSEWADAQPTIPLLVDFWNRMLGLQGISKNTSPIEGPESIEAQPDDDNDEGDDEVI